MIAWNDAAVRTISDIRTRVSNAKAQLENSQVSKIPLTSVPMQSAVPATAVQAANVTAIASPGIRRYPKGHPKGGKFVPKDVVLTAPTAATPAPTPAPTPARVKVLAFKGFDTDGKGEIRCRSHKFEVGKEYSVSGTAKLCSNGFHACEDPFKVFEYYSLHQDHVFGRVELLDQIDKGTSQDDKIVGKTIKVLEVFSLPHLINALAKFARENPNADTVKDTVNVDAAAEGIYWDFLTERASRRLQRISRRMLSTRREAIQQISPNTSIAMALGANSVQYGRARWMVSYGDHNQTYAVGANCPYASIEILGEHSGVVFNHSNTTIKARAGTTVTFTGQNTDPRSNQKPIAPQVFIAGKDFAADKPISFSERTAQTNVLAPREV